jgi:hypothetical protein
MRRVKAIAAESELRVIDSFLKIVVLRVKSLDRDAHPRAVAAIKPKAVPDEPPERPFLIRAFMQLIP